MFHFAKQMQTLILNPFFQAQSQSSSVATKAPKYESVLMGYDFHTQHHGLPQLIEINNNAGGLYLPKFHQWLKQPKVEALNEAIETRLLHMFDNEWCNIAIVDEIPQQQFMYPEMQAYARLLSDDGRKVFIVDPSELEKTAEGLSYQGQHIDMIYNRHTDFYLESVAMQAIREAYMADQVVLNPHPQSYDLLGDKGRMVDWHHTAYLEQFISKEKAQIIRAMIPETKYVHEQDMSQLWAERKHWVFKPTASHAGKGVVLGKSITRKRFAEIQQPNMIMQAFVPPAKVSFDDVSYKYDVRLYMHGPRLIAIAGRIYQGMLTNFRTEGSGFVPVTLNG